jgi:prevent-host-death family protein
MAWPVQEAKQQFSRVVEAARTEGPQVVTRHGREVAVILSIDDYRAMGGGSIKEALRALAEADDGRYAAILDDVVSERRLGLPRDLPMEP